MPISKNGAQIPAGANLVFQPFDTTDNMHAGIELPGCQGGHLDGKWGAITVEDSVVVGLSGTDWEPHEIIMGIETPCYHRLLISNTTFANFESTMSVALGALPKEKFRKKGGGWEVRFEQVK